MSICSGNTLLNDASPIYRSRRRRSRDVWLYVAKDSVAAADRLIARLVEAAKPLRNFPEMGGSRDELSPELRALRVGPYLMFYRRRQDDIVIERILHGSRDIQGDLF